MYLNNMYIKEFNDIPFIGCINLLSRNDRFNHIVNQFKKLNILDKVNFLRVKKHKLGGRVGCYDSHLQLYRHCLKNNFEYALIFEDDIEFEVKYKKQFIKNINYIINLNPNWSIINCSNQFCKIRKINKNIFNAISTNAHCYLISKKAMKKSLKLGITKYHIDNIHASLFNFNNMYLIFPSFVKLIFFISDNDWELVGNKTSISKTIFFNNMIKLYRNLLLARTNILIKATNILDYKKELVTLCDMNDKIMIQMKNHMLNPKRKKISINKDEILLYSEIKNNDIGTYKSKKINKILKNKNISKKHNF